MQNSPPIGAMQLINKGEHNKWLKQYACVCKNSPAIGAKQLINKGVQNNWLK